MLGQRRRRWASIEPTLGELLVPANDRLLQDITVAEGNEIGLPASIGPMLL